MEIPYYPFCPFYNPNECSQNPIVEIEDCWRIDKLGYVSCFFTRTGLAHGERIPDSPKAIKIRMGQEDD